MKKTYEMFMKMYENLIYSIIVKYFFYFLNNFQEFLKLVIVFSLYFA